MSIETEITRIKGAKADIKTAIENKGVTVGDGTIDTYAAKVAAIPEPTGSINITENGDNIDVAQYATANVNVSSGIPDQTFTVGNNWTGVPGSSANVKSVDITGGSIVSVMSTMEIDTMDFDWSDMLALFDNDGWFHYDYTIESGGETYTIRNKLYTVPISDAPYDNTINSTIAGGFPNITSSGSVFPDVVDWNNGESQAATIVRDGVSGTVYKFPIHAKNTWLDNLRPRVAYSSTKQSNFGKIAGTEEDLPIDGIGIFSVNYSYAMLYTANIYNVQIQGADVAIWKQEYDSGSASTAYDRYMVVFIKNGATKTLQDVKNLVDGKIYSYCYGIDDPSGGQRIECRVGSYNYINLTQPEFQSDWADFIATNPEGVLTISVPTNPYAYQYFIKGKKEVNFKLSDIVGTAKAMNMSYQNTSYVTENHPVVVMTGDGFDLSVINSVVGQRS